MVDLATIGDSYLVAVMYTIDRNHRYTSGLPCHIQDPTLYIHSGSCVSGFRIWGDYTKRGDYGLFQPGCLFSEEVW